jgi:hypothetical protein
VAIVAALGYMSAGHAKDSAGGVGTSRPAQLVATAEGVEVTPILSTGDLVPSSDRLLRRGYQMTGIPDGLGAYAKSSGTLSVLMNHELGGTKPAGVGARVSHLSIDPETGKVLDASYPVTGREGFLRFCSATLSNLGGKPMYFTGEESTSDGALTSNPDDGLGRGGSSIALDPEKGTYTETRHFGLLPHENVVPVKGLSQAVVLTTEDGSPTGNRSQLYAYIAPTFSEAISGTKGSLYVWRADDGVADGDPSTNDIEQGQTLAGHFVPVTQQENLSATALESAAQSKGAFDFVRLEDAAVSKTANNRLYITDTGSLGSESARGRLYRLEFNKDDPTKAKLTLELDLDKQAADPTDPNNAIKMTNPDNLDTSRSSIVIQEDRNEEFRDENYSRVLVYDIASKQLRVVARVDTPQGSQPGSWESSGVINAFDLLGQDKWLLDVQAHTATAPQPGPDLVPNSSSGEDGQLLQIEIPNS